MSNVTIRTGPAGLPPSNVQAGTTHTAIADAGPHTPISYPPGTPVAPSATKARTVVPGRANAAGTSSLAGLTATPADVGDPVKVQSDGVLTLTTEQWDAITGDSGGLVRNTRYYLNATFFEGRLTTTPPSSVSTFVAPVGVALSATDFLIQLCTPIEIVA
jgi:hypothetical protein